jgi:homoserine kinase type II
VENSNYALRTERGDFILTLYEKRVDPAELPYFLRADAAPGPPRPALPATPVPARDGAALRMLCGRPAAICTFLEGVWPRRVRPEHLAPLGAALARLHAAGEGFATVRPNALGPAGWPRVLEGCRARGNEVAPGLVAELDLHLADILASWPREGRAARRPHPCRPLPRQRLLPARCRGGGRMFRA